MAVTIDATVGGASANSYVTAASATSYFEGRLDATDWSGATSDNQNRALVMAARRLDQEEYMGVRVNETQALQWPRYGVEKPDLAYSVISNPINTIVGGTWYDTDEIPARVQNAQMELALALLKDTELLDDTGLAAYTNVKIGDLDVTPRHGQTAGELPDIVKRELRPLLKALPGGVRLRRG